MIDEPSFALATFIEHDDGGGGVNLSVTISEPDATDAPAPNALLYGLAILMLNQSGAIDEMMNAICADGAPTKAEAIRQIQFLLQDDANDLRA